MKEARRPLEEVQVPAVLDPTPLTRGGAPAIRTPATAPAQASGGERHEGGVSTSVLAGRFVRGS